MQSSVLGNNLVLSSLQPSQPNCNAHLANCVPGTGLANSYSNQSINQSVAADIQAQFELLVELRRFVNIDLFQRGYYQVRVQIKCLNKQMPIKIMLQLEKNQNNTNLSGQYLSSY